MIRNPAVMMMLLCLVLQYCLDLPSTDQEVGDECAEDSAREGEDRAFNYDYVSVGPGGDQAVRVRSYHGRDHQRFCQSSRDTDSFRLVCFGFVSGVDCRGEYSWKSCGYAA